MIRRKIRKMRRRLAAMLSRRLDKPLPPPTQEEQELVNRLRGELDASCGLSGHPETCETAWSENIRQLCRNVKDADPRAFLRWEVIQRTMAVTHAEYIPHELRFLRRRRDWAHRWAPALQEDRFGHPLPYWRHPTSSGNLIHHAYHCASFEEAMGRRVDDFGTIVEFGGGYGGMCRLIHRLGFRGRYVIFDLPAFSALQRFFLAGIGLAVSDHPIAGVASGVVECLSDLGLLSEVCQTDDRPSRLFLATWSLSETPLPLRERLQPCWPRFDGFLIAYQSVFQGIDNVAFFTTMRDTLGGGTWREHRMTHMRNDNRYLFGLRGDC